MTCFVEGLQRAIWERARDERGDEAKNASRPERADFLAGA